MAHLAAAEYGCSGAMNSLQLSHVLCQCLLRCHISMLSQPAELFFSLG